MSDKKSIIKGVARAELRQNGSISNFVSSWEEMPLSCQAIDFGSNLAYDLNQLLPPLSNDTEWYFLKWYISHISSCVKWYWCSRWSLNYPLALRFQTKHLKKPLYYIIGLNMLHRRWTLLRVNRICHSL